jgi:hypothetical protein
MSKEEKDVVSIVYRRFIESESDKGWTDFDDNVIFFDYLTDKEIIIESLVKISKQLNGVRCKVDHKIEHCFAPYILEAVEAITKLYKESEDLHEKNRYILIFYLVMCEMELIYGT